MAIQWLIQNVTAATSAVQMNTLNIARPRWEDVSLDVGRVTFDVPGRAIDAALLFNYGDVVKIIRRDTSGPTDTTIFVGRCTLNPRMGDPSGAEQHDYELSDPFWYLANQVFQQNWAKPVDPTNPATALTTELRSHLILGMNQSTGAHLTLSQMLTELNNFFITCDSPAGTFPVRISTTVPVGWNLAMPFNEVRAVTCLEVLRFLFRWVPDLQTWIDYSTTYGGGDPLPTIKFGRWADASPRHAWSYTPGDGTEFKGVPHFRARPDLQKTGVVLQYEQINNAAGGSWTQTTIDVYPGGTTGLKPTDAVGVVQLAGGSSTLHQQYLKTQNNTDATSGGTNTDATRVAWWKQHLPWLADATISNIKIDSPALADDGGGSLAAYSYEVIDGAIPEWKNTAKKNGVATAQISYDVTQSSTVVSKVVKKPVSVNFLATNLSANSGITYSNTITTVTPETVPTGLAQRLYQATADLHFEGTARFAFDDLPADFIRPGDSLAIVGCVSPGEMVQRVVSDFFEATVEATFGPPQHLGPQDLIELLRVIRGQGIAWSMASRQAATAPSSGQSTGPRAATQKTGSSGAAGPFTKLVFVDTTDTTKQMKIDPSTLATGEVVQLQTVKVWDDASSSCKTMKVLGTTPV